MQAIEAYLIQEVEEAYKKVEALQAIIHARDLEITFKRTQIETLEARVDEVLDENENMAADIDLYQGEVQNLLSYTGWLEKRVAIQRRGMRAHPVPRRVLRRTFMRQDRQVVMRNVEMPDVIYVTENFIDWQEIFDLTTDV